jgi:hypothetical protein
VCFTVYLQIHANTREPLISGVDPRCQADERQRAVRIPLMHAVCHVTAPRVKPRWRTDPQIQRYTRTRGYSQLSLRITATAATSSTTFPSIIALKMEAVRTSETSVNSYQSTRRYSTENSHLCTHRRENLKPDTIPYFLIRTCRMLRKVLLHQKS